MPLGMEVGLGPGDFVLDGDPALPSPKGGQSPSPQFSAHFYCGQTAACIKMPLGMEVGLIPRDFVLDGDLAPSPSKNQYSFIPCRPARSISERLGFQVREMSDRRCRQDEARLEVPCELSDRLDPTYLTADL